MFKRSLVLLAAVLGAGFAQWTPRGGGDHLGANWTLAGTDTVSGFHYNIGKCSIPTGVTVCVYQWNSGDSTGGLQIRANDIVALGNLSGAGRGYGGGGGGENSNVAPPLPGGPGGYGGKNGNGGNGQHAYWSGYGWPSTAYFGGGGGGSPNGTGGQGQANGAVGTWNGGGNGGSPTNGGGPGGAGGIGYGAGGGGGGGFSAGGGGGGGGGTGGDSAYWYNGGRGTGTYGGPGGVGGGSNPTQATSGGYRTSNGNGDASTDSSVYRGGGGGGAGSSSNGGLGGGGGGGGAGGAYVRLEAGNSIYLGGNIQTSGAAGGQSAGPSFTSYYGGGGAGGGILFAAPYVTLASGSILDCRGRQFQTLSTQNGGTIKVFYGQLTDQSTKYYGRLYTAQMSIHDVAAIRILAPAGALDSGQNVTPVCSLRNYGMFNESYTARMKIGTSYNATISVTGHTNGTSLYVTFPNWLALERGTLVVSCSTELAADMNPSNNKLTGSVLVTVGDVGVSRIIAPPAAIDSGTTTTPACSVYNCGSGTALNYAVRMRIGAGYNATATVTSHAAGTAVYVTFPAWTAGVRGSTAIRCSTEYGVDVQPANDAASASVMVNVHDPGPNEIVNPLAVTPPGPTVPQVSARDFGTTRNACSITLKINALTPYSQTVNLPAGLPAGVDTIIEFPSWTAEVGSYTARCSLYSATDQVPGNNVITKNFAVGEADVGVLAILAPTGIHDTTEGLSTSARFRNYGEFAASFKTFFVIDKGTDSLVYAESLAVANLAAGSETTLVYPAWPKPHPVGSYVTACSTWMAGDASPANDRLTGTLTIRVGGAGGDTGWVRKADVLTGPKNKNVKDGGCLAHLPSDSAYVYLLKGGNTSEFYRYNTGSDAWLTEESIPAIGSSGKKKLVKKGGTLSQTGGKLYATKGSSTTEWWQYDPALSGTPTYSWTQKTDVPTGLKMVKEGAGAAAITIGDTTYVYFLKGSATQEFYRYNSLSNSWQTMTSAPTGASGKAFKAGSTITSDPDGRTIYAIKGSYNEFFAYSVDSNTWTTRAPLPLTGREGKKRKLKDGAGLAFHSGVVYALKGGNTNEFWLFQADSNRWVQGPDMPLVAKRVKGGGALVYAEPAGGLYATRGNNTREFYRYGLPVDGLPLTANGNKNTQSAFRTTQSAFGIRLCPSVLVGGSSSPVRIDYTLPSAADYSLKLFDITGQLVATLASGYHNAGSYSVAAPRLARGIYVIKLTASNTTTTAKLIVE
jgi:hypothetical protein